MDRRIRAQHPWVYSNELMNSPKGILPGSLIELRDSRDEFLAIGYGHPNSLISFRALSFKGRDAELSIEALLTQTLQRAAQLRHQLGLSHTSHRLVHAESDGIPGLIIERFLLKNSKQVFVVQAQTAGAQKLLPDLESTLKNLTLWENENQKSSLTWEDTSLLFKNDSNMRKLDGLEIEAPKWIHNPLTDETVEILTQLPGQKEVTSFTIDLINGQKTGFFLDQAYNIKLVSDLLEQQIISTKKQSLRILDLFCYVGQWGSWLSKIGKKHQLPVAVDLVDSSVAALKLAEQNTAQEGVQTRAHKMDIMDLLSQLKEPTYDVVVCDPPALIKGKKDLPTGQRGYLKVNTEALKHTHVGSIYVSCSCSGLLKDEDFEQMLAQAARRAGKTVSWIARGSQAPDHPTQLSFPEGRYLKSWIGIVQA
ncbi:MAG: class I SAM-dependent rRNA methyltransferase [Bdellovibrionales bacterium]